VCAYSSYLLSLGLTQDVSRKRLLKRLKDDVGDRRMAARLASRAEILHVEEVGYMEMETPVVKTYNVTQREIKDNVDLRTAKNSFNLNLDQMGPYRACYTRAGKHLLLAGNKGHVAMMDWKSKRLVCEFHTKDRVLCSTFLHNETWFALAQSKYVHIYDKNGTELHVSEREMEGFGFSFPKHLFLTRFYAHTKNLPTLSICHTIGCFARAEAKDSYAGQTYQWVR
jgi:U3 small nucleolar RNA-associated protein 7